MLQYLFHLSILIFHSRINTKPKIGLPSLTRDFAQTPSFSCTGDVVWKKFPSSHVITPAQTLVLLKHHRAIIGHHYTPNHHSLGSTFLNSSTLPKTNIEPPNRWKLLDVGWNSYRCFSCSKRPHGLLFESFVWGENVSTPFSRGRSEFMNSWGILVHRAGCPSGWFLTPRDKVNQNPGAPLGVLRAPCKAHS